jgi:hypothetical protein
MKDSACNVLSQGLKQKSLLENSSDSVRFVVVMSLKMRYPLAVLFTFLLYNCSALSEAVERLVEFRVENSQVRMTNHPPIQLEQIEEESRNWEGVVRLNNRGFLLITDKYPETIFAFVRISELDQ